MAGSSQTTRHEDEVAIIRQMDGSTHSTKNEEEDVASLNGQKEGWIAYLGGINWVQRFQRWMTHEGDDEWLPNTRGNVSLVASIIATMSFQMTLNPPGGVKAVSDEVVPCIPKVDKDLNDKLCHGEAVLPVVYPDAYLQFLHWNTVCFFTSLTVCLLLVSGIPINHRFPVYLLSIAMCVALTCLVHAYAKAVSMTSPYSIWQSAMDFQTKFIYTWVIMLFLLAFILTVRFFIWLTRTIPNETEEEIPAAT